MDQNQERKPPNVSILWDDRPEWSTLIILVLFMVALLVFASYENAKLKDEIARLKKQEFTHELQDQLKQKQITQPMFDYDN